MWIASEHCNRVPCCHLTLPLNGEIEASPAAREKPSHHRVRLKPDPELVAGQTRLRDDHASGTDGELVAYVDRCLVETFCCQVFAEHAQRQLAPSQLVRPPSVVFVRVAVDRFEFAAMDAQIGLPIAIQIEPA